MATSNHSALSLFLGRLLRRSMLSGEEREAILGMLSHASQTRAHRDIVSPGDRVGHACLIVDGLAGRFDSVVNGHRQFTAFHIPGDMCDLHSVVIPTASWGIEALATTTVLRVPHAEVRRVAYAYPAVALAFWRDTTVDASIVAKWVTNVGRKDARSRTAHLLCEMAVRMEQAGIGSREAFVLDATQAQLADALGLTPVHVNRTLKALRQEHLLTTEGRCVRIQDWQGLAALGQFDPAFLHVAAAPSEAER